MQRAESRSARPLQGWESSVARPGAATVPGASPSLSAASRRRARGLSGFYRLAAASSYAPRRCGRASSIAHTRRSDARDRREEARVTRAPVDWRGVDLPLDGLRDRATHCSFAQRRLATAKAARPAAASSFFAAPATGGTPSRRARRRALARESRRATALRRSGRTSGTHLDCSARRWARECERSQPGFPGPSGQSALRSLHRCLGKADDLRNQTNHEKS